ncbi:MAG: DUF3048 domain-containing protein [Chloroflexota bacterium]
MNHSLRTLTLTLFLTACIPFGEGAGPATVVISIPSPAATATPPFVESASTPLPSVTSAPAPTLTAAPTETPTQTPTVTPLPAGQIGPIDFPPNVNPLTGETVSDPAVLNRRPLAIKVSNYPSCVRPQAGLSLADLVFAHYAEGGATRFTAIFYSHDAPKVGSIRSARLIDLEIPALYQSLFAFSGASPGVLNKLKEADFKDWILSPEFEPGHKAFFRVPKESLAAECQALEHTLFTSTDRLWADADAKGINQRPTLTGMAFNAQPPAGGQPGAIVSLAYSAEYVRWTYSETAGLYYRYANGARHMDMLTDAQITAANVVVVFANHVLTDILESAISFDPRTGKGGSHSLEIQLWGTGPAFVYRDGLVYSVTWVRQDRFGVLGLVDTATGQLFALKPGNTWFQLVALDSPVTSGEANSWEIVPPRPTEAP